MSNLKEFFEKIKCNAAKCGITESNIFVAFGQRVKTYLDSYKGLSLLQGSVKAVVDSISYVVYNGIAFLGYAIAYCVVFC